MRKLFQKIKNNLPLKVKFFLPVTQNTCFNIWKMNSELTQKTKKDKELQKKIKNNKNYWVDFQYFK